MDGKRTAGNPAAGAWGEWGEVTLSGRHSGGVSGGERRRVRVCLPGGYQLVPDRGETVLVVKSGPEEAPRGGWQVEEAPARRRCGSPWRQARGFG